MQREETNGQAPLTIVVPLSSKLAAARFSGTVVIAPEGPSGLVLRSVALIFQLRAVDRARFKVRLGQLSSSEIDEVRAEMRRFLDL